MTTTRWQSAWIILALFVIAPHRAAAHCDGLDGPVVKAAQMALATGNLNHALIWVQKGDEAELRNAFAQTINVRKIDEAKDLADRYFLETVVRLHRAGEGAPYTGLKPAGRDFGPAIPAVDKALESGSASPLLKLLSDLVRTQVSRQFQATLAKRNFDPNDVEQGRAYVKAYVEFVHYAERIYGSTKDLAKGHYKEEAEEVPARSR